MSAQQTPMSSSKKRGLKHEITVILVLKILFLCLLWWLFFAGHKVVVDANNMLHDPIIHPIGDPSGDQL